MSDEIIDFDEYVDQYEELLKSQLSFFNSSRDYFSAYKIHLLKQNLETTPQRILDFGCGIGLNLPHLIQAFPQAEIYATDISHKSLAYVSAHYPTVKILKNPQESTDFDLIFLAGVMHHIPPRQRLQTMKEIKSLLSSSGTVCIFEHNPFNPITRKIVNECPFDKGVVLLSQNNLKSLMKESNIKPYKAHYCLFFPDTLRFLRPAERLLRWLPLGGQHFVMGRNG